MRWYNLAPIIKFSMDKSMESPERKHLDQGSALPEKRLDLPFEQSRLAADRTIMSWIRTSLAMIGFGFTIYKFFQYLKESGASPNFPDQRPRNFGSALVILGTLFLVFATIEYFSFIGRLNKETGHKFRVTTVAVASVLISLIGLIALADLLFRIGPF
jgi:inner membrane protein YidH